jgi:hypothetical protein
MKKTLDDGIEIDTRGLAQVMTAKDGTILCSAEVFGSQEIVHFLQSPDGKTATLDTLDNDNIAEAAAILGMTERELRSNLWP